jgi:tRNA G10  N-methylase Trm11
MFELSKEHQSLPKDEIICCLKAESIEFDIILSLEDILIIDANISSTKIGMLSNRLSHSYSLNEFLFNCSPTLQSIRNFAATTPIPQKGSLAITYRNRSKKLLSQPLLQALADSYTNQRNVDLNNPDVEIRLIITDSEVFVGRNITKINGRF